ncbi:MAG TPA: hypothetical protein VKY65_22030 [Alphaproteobacteria bacterium]|nr:hypothetical protein [Alphaproteobacteria bacterium]
MRWRPPPSPHLTLSGLVDADRYTDNFTNFPAMWRDDDFAGVLPKGTPVAQCIPVKREAWALRCGTLSAEATQRIIELRRTLADQRDAYRRRFRAGKR